MHGIACHMTSTRQCNSDDILKRSRTFSEPNKSLIFIFSLIYHPFRLRGKLISLSDLLIPRDSLPELPLHNETIVVHLPLTHKVLFKFPAAEIHRACEGGELEHPARPDPKSERIAPAANVATRRRVDVVGMELDG